MEITLTDTQQFVITEDKLREGLEERFGDGDLCSEDFRNYKVDYLFKDYRSECYEVITQCSSRKSYLDTQIEVEEVA